MLNLSMFANNKTSMEFKFILVEFIGFEVDEKIYIMVNIQLSNLTFGTIRLTAKIDNNFKKFRLEILRERCFFYDC